jgi:hypothetical protein
MTKEIRRSLAVIIALMMAQMACSFSLAPASPTAAPQDNTGLIATQTLAALATAIQATVDAASSSLPPQAATSTPELPAATSTETETPTPEATATASMPIALVQQNTNCRSGNSTQFALLYSALAGNQLAIVSATTDPGYVIVEIPTKPGQTCWLWLQYVQISGDIRTLPVATPPPTPTPGVTFSLNFHQVNSCVGWGIGMKVVNSGSVTYKSYRLTVKDKDTSTTIQQSANNFDKQSGCLVATAIPKLEPGQSGYAYAYDFSYNPAGHNLEATAKLCTETNLGGTCAMQSISFKP